MSRGSLCVVSSDRAITLDRDQRGRFKHNAVKFESSLGLRQDAQKSGSIDWRQINVIAGDAEKRTIEIPDHPFVQKGLAVEVRLVLMVVQVGQQWNLVVDHGLFRTGLDGLFKDNRMAQYRR